MTQTREGRVLQPADLFRWAEIKGAEEAEKVLGHAYAFLNHMSVGDVLETSSVRFTKLSEDLIHVESLVNAERMVDALAKRRLLRFPV